MKLPPKVFMRGVSTAVMLWSGLLGATDRRVAITIDDLPRGRDGGGSSLEAIRQMTKTLLRPFADQKIPVTGFVNEGRPPGFRSESLREILNLWLDAGADLGNHSYSHPDINNVTLAEYEADVLRGEPVVRSVLNARGKQLAFYRHPFLHTGATTDRKKDLADFLRQHGYREAPVTLDNGDYIFAAAYMKSEFHDRVVREYLPYMESIVSFFEQRSIEVFGKEIPQILVIHASQMNADLMPKLLAMFRNRGYRFVSLEDALKDEAYRAPENYGGKRGFSWIHRWSQAKGMPNRGEPDPPAWLPNQ